MPNKYGPKARKKISRVMHEYGEGKLKSGRSNKKVKSRKQAIAIGISEARKVGGKTPKPKSASKKKSKKKSAKTHSRKQGKTRSR